MSKGFYIAAEDLGAANNYIIVPEIQEYSPKENLTVTSLINFLEHHLPKYL